jgi:hypothetical protein
LTLRIVLCEISLESRIKHYAKLPPMSSLREAAGSCGFGPLG